MEKESSTVALLEEKKKTRLMNYNVFLVGLCFAFIFTGFYTMSQTQVSKISRCETPTRPSSTIRLRGRFLASMLTAWPGRLGTHHNPSPPQ
jgi:hypothetical protein